MQAIDNKELLRLAREVPLFEIIEGPAPKGAKRFSGPYNPEEGELLAGTMRALTKRTAYLLAWDSDGLFCIYRRAA